MSDVDLSALQHLTDREHAELLDLVDQDPTVWRPLQGPQLDAFSSEADIVGYGGAAGGGKTDLVAGLATTKHEKTLILRREKAQTEGIVQRIEEILGTRDGYSSQKGAWRTDDQRLIEFGGLDNPGDERRWQGRPHDLCALDEVTEMREAQVRFVLGWVRTNDDERRTRVIMTFNPPTTAEGRWVIEFFGPWLDRKHPNPALPGELRWFTTLAGQDYEVPDGHPFVIVDDDQGYPERVYDFDPDEFAPEQVVKPKSRTFIPARVVDNPYYMATDYISTLQAMPEPLRSQMLYGDFAAGIEDDEFQVIPTAWVEAAMAKWSKPDRLAPMDSVGVDVAMKGRDKTIIFRRHGDWYDEPVVYEGRECIDGPTIAGFVVARMRDLAVIHLDLFGVGAQPFGCLMEMQLQTIGVNVGDPAPGTDLTGRWYFSNLRSQMWWKMREALDPANNRGLVLPPDKRLLADLCAPKWEPVGNKIKVQGRKELMKTLGRSPDFGSALLLAAMDTPKRQDLRDALGRAQSRPGRGHDPFAALSQAQGRASYDHDPID